MSRVIHFEIAADNPDRAIAFYSQVFRWEFSKWGEHDYWLITTGPDSEPGINGGLNARCPDAAGPGMMAFVCTVSVPDVDASLQAVKAAGGTVAHEKMAIPGVGWLAYGKDTEGNMFGMMTQDPQAA